MGYGPEDKNTVLELTYNYGVTDYNKGNGYAQVDSILSAFRRNFTTFVWLPRMFAVCIVRIQHILCLNRLQ